MEFTSYPESQLCFSHSILAKDITMEEPRKYQVHVITCLIILAILFVAAILSNQNSTNRVKGNSICIQKVTDTAACSNEACNRIGLIQIDIGYSEIRDSGHI